MELLTHQIFSIFGAGNFADKSTGGTIDSQYNGGKRGAPKSCANDVGVAAIIGAIIGIPAGPAGVLAGSSAAAAYQSIGSCNNSPYRGNDNGCNNSSSGPDYGGQCTW